MKSESDISSFIGQADAPPPVVLHLVGRVTDTVFSFLGPATAALAEQGIPQTVVLIDDPLYRHLLPKFHESVRLVLTPASGSTRERLKHLLDAYCDAANARRPSVVHLHGVVCSLIGMYASRFRGLKIPTYFSPHGSRSLGPMRGVGVALLWLLQPVTGRSEQRVIANIGADARMLTGVTRQSVDLIESPVAEAFFETPLAPAAAPAILTGHRAPNPEGAALFAQWAVLLADQVPGLRFNWIGTADAESIARLKAANVTPLDVSDEGERAARMAASWVYVAPSGGLGFPVFMAEAMALGLPCVAWDTPYHRDIVRHGETGFLCRDTNQVLETVALLIESADLRRQIGDAAREEARQRFDGSKFRDSLLSAYGTPSRF
jgi:hypothetical protein